MAEEILEVFDVMHAGLGGRSGVGEDCILFFTPNRIIVAKTVSKFIDPKGWGGIFIPIGLVIVLLMNNPVLGFAVAFGGFGVTWILSSIMKRRNERKLEWLHALNRVSPHDIQRTGIGVDEIPYSEITKVDTQASSVFVPNFNDEHRRHVPGGVPYNIIIQFVTQTERHGFIPKSQKDLDRCMSLIRKILPDKMT